MDTRLALYLFGFQAKSAPPGGSFLGDPGISENWPWAEPVFF
jgi:hypothetical protein